MLNNTLFLRYVIDTDFSGEFCRRCIRPRIWFVRKSEPSRVLHFAKWLSHTIGVNNGSRLVTGKIDWYRFHLSLAKRPSPYANWRHDLAERYVLCGMCDPFWARGKLCDQINLMTSYFCVRIVDKLKRSSHTYQIRGNRLVHCTQNKAVHRTHKIQYVYSNDMQII